MKQKYLVGEDEGERYLVGEDEGERKLHLVSWDLITIDRKDEGLGIKDIIKHNEAFIMKLYWKFLNNSTALWVCVLRCKYRCLTTLHVYEEGPIDLSHLEEHM